MSPAMNLAVHANEEDENEYQKGVKYLCEKGIAKVPNKYILPVMERPNKISKNDGISYPNLKLPVIDFMQLQGSNRIEVLNSLSKACEEYGFFQLINHGISREAITKMVEVGRNFFELPFEERSKYMSNDMKSPARYGTSFNQNKDRVFCWRDFLKLNCNPLSESLPFWPSFPSQLRETAVNYSEKSKLLYLTLVKAILESLGLDETSEKDENYMKEFEDGSQVLVVNCYPECPEPDLTLGMPPHSDYGFLTLVLQDQLVKGLQIQHQEKWVTVDPIPNSIVVNVGDHLEIFSNGKYKSVLHRVLVNSSKSRISIASLHSLPFSSTIRPSPKLVNGDNPKRYKDTNFAHFMDYITSCEHKTKNFLESRKLKS
ncbi:probable 2-oxoglutarate-dependent dioxygenase SLC1 [Mercurialis annua]|uniref:probable 2-oxoglutarate-dependent dioxygenase SLC1 n=1 Tax=Mercurialis annua TaxID=3986 RepID=UPI00215E34C2|nr:probable 2-oxoglutarate-dependent dioxygenase SLC1 [Mercurialis annua]